MLLTPVPGTSTLRNLRGDPLKKNREWTKASYGKAGWTAARPLCPGETLPPARQPRTMAPPAANREDTAALAPSGGREATLTPAEAGTEAAAGAGSERQKLSTYALCGLPPNPSIQ